MLSVAPRYQSEWSYCDRVIEPAHSSAATNAWDKAVGAAWATGDVAAWGGGVGAKASAACGGGAGCGGAGFAERGFQAAREWLTLSHQMNEFSPLVGWTGAVKA